MTPANAIPMPDATVVTTDHAACAVVTTPRPIAYAFVASVVAISASFHVTNDTTRMSATRRNASPAGVADMNMSVISRTACAPAFAARPISVSVSPTGRPFSVASPNRASRLVAMNPTRSASASYSTLPATRTSDSRSTKPWKMDCAVDPNTSPIRNSSAVMVAVNTSTPSASPMLRTVRMNVRISPATSWNTTPIAPSGDFSASNAAGASLVNTFSNRLIVGRKMPPTSDWRFANPACMRFCAPAKSVAVSAKLPCDVAAPSRIRL